MRKGKASKNYQGLADQKGVQLCYIMSSSFPIVSFLTDCTQ